MHTLCNFEILLSNYLKIKLVYRSRGEFKKKPEKLSGRVLLVKITPWEPACYIPSPIVQTSKYNAQKNSIMGLVGNVKLNCSIKGCFACVSVSALAGVEDNICREVYTR